MKESLKDKIALITGASRGIGRAIAGKLAELGARVLLAARDEAALAWLAGDIAERGGKVDVCPVNLEDSGSIKRLAEKVRRDYQRLDILVNNAGVAVNRPIEKTGDEDWDRCMATNARGAFFLIRECLGLLEKAEPGYIINICSVVGVKGYAQQIAYSASKHAMRGMSIALAEELRDRNIRVHVICPGGVFTDMAQDMRPDINEDELITPEEIADLVAYLVTYQGNGVIDEIRMRRQTAAPGFG